MAAVIFHGPPGSYKTSSAIWFEMLSALRKGRTVVTNIEGMKTVDDIEQELNETFPEGAQIWRLSTQKKKGLELFRSFFHWAPIGAQIIIDEVQDVFPSETSFKPDIYDYQPISVYKDLLPKKWLETHYELLDSIKPDDYTSADSDDLGELIFDDNGRIIYPTTLKESFMRHRKYNWDIVVCTPDITQVNKLIRGSCESGFAHVSKDVMGKVIPYFKRRPRIRQHPPKESGQVAKKADLITYRKVPVEVHKLYKSTSTGKVNTSGVGKSPLQSPVFIAYIAFILFVIIYLAYNFGFSDTASETNKESRTSAIQKRNEGSRQDILKDTGVSVGNAFGETTDAVDVFLRLPNEPTEVYLIATNKVYQSGIFQGVQMTFELITKSGKLYIDETNIKHFGMDAKYITDCVANIKMGDVIKTVYCKPTTQQDLKVIPELRPTREISLL
jgi:zona occludens toxin